jgi:transcriptional regulator with XRE-family HTH domain
MEKGYTQAYLAEQLTMIQTAYHKLENGKTKLKVSLLIKIAKVLELAPEKLID